MLNGMRNTDESERYTALLISQIPVQYYMKFGKNKNFSRNPLPTGIFKQIESFRF
jgi:hypothetical protein